MRLARPQVLGILEIANPRAAKLLPEPRDAAAHDREDNGLEDRLVVQGETTDEHQPKQETERGGEKPRTKTAEPRGKQDGGDENEKGGVLPKPWVQAPSQHEQ